MVIVVTICFVFTESSSPGEMDILQLALDALISRRPSTVQSCLNAEASEPAKTACRNCIRWIAENDVER